MRKLTIISLLFLIAGCGPKIQNSKGGLYHVLTEQVDGGATIRFVEILNEEKEIKMLLSDPNLKKQINPADLKMSTFVVLNMGEKSLPGYKIEVANIIETPTRIIVETKDIAPEILGISETDVYYYPYTVLKINSKKPIEVK